MRVVVTGAGGQLGLELAEILPGRGHETVALSRAELDIADPDAVEDAVKGYAPDLVVNAAAYTNVDGCEAETDLAYAVNALGPRNLAQTCEGLGCKLLHVSTNYVFDGEANLLHHRQAMRFIHAAHKGSCRREVHKGAYA